MTHEQKVAAMQRIATSLKEYRDGKSYPEGIDFDFNNVNTAFDGGYCFVHILRTPRMKETITVHLNSYMWDDLHPTYITIIELLLL